MKKKKEKSKKGFREETKDQNVCESAERRKQYFCGKKVPVYGRGVEIYSVIKREERREVRRGANVITIMRLNELSSFRR